MAKDDLAKLIMNDGRWLIRGRGILRLRKMGACRSILGRCLRKYIWLMHQKALRNRQCTCNTKRQAAIRTGLKSDVINHWLFGNCSLYLGLIPNIKILKVELPSFDTYLLSHACDSDWRQKGACHYLLPSSTYMKYIGHCCSSCCSWLFKWNTTTRYYWRLGRYVSSTHRDWRTAKEEFPGRTCGRRGCYYGRKL